MDNALEAGDIPGSNFQVDACHTYSGKGIGGDRQPAATGKEVVVQPQALVWNGGHIAAEVDYCTATAAATPAAEDYCIAVAKENDCAVTVAVAAAKDYCTGAAAVLVAMYSAEQLG